MVSGRSAYDIEAGRVLDRCDRVSTVSGVSTGNARGVITQAEAVRKTSSARPPGWRAAGEEGAVVGGLAALPGINYGKGIDMSC